jgi:hypothetical protein
VPERRTPPPPPLATPAPHVPQAVDATTVTGNLVVTVSEIDLATGAIGRLGVLVDALRGTMEVHGGDRRALVEPVVVIDGRPATLVVEHWHRGGSWVPSWTAAVPGGRVEATVLAPMDEAGGPSAR